MVERREQAGALHPGSEEFRAVIAEFPAARRDPLLRLADWADALERDGLVKLATYSGTSGITTLLPRLAGDDAGLVSISCDAKTRAYMQFWRSVFERRAPHSISAVEAVLGTELKQGNSTRDFSVPLLDALNQAYQEAAGKPDINPNGPHHAEPDRLLAVDPGVVKRRGHVRVYERSRDATATCCAVSASPGLIPRGSHRPRAAGPQPGSGR